jgi:two-component sensor histidine kinase/PAS domain-containing protein
MQALSPWPIGDSEAAALIRGYQWSPTPLGPVETWTPSLRTAIDLLLAAKAEIVLFCGPEFIAIYNDAYAPTIGNKHPRALGRPAKENWGELWDDLEPLLQGVLQSGRTFSAKDRPFYIERSGSVGEIVYFDVSYSPVRRPDGSVEAVLCIVSETTERVLAGARVRESEQRFRALVTASSDVVYRMSPDWQEMQQLDGRDLPSYVAGSTIRWKDDLLFPQDRALVQAAIDDAIANRSVFQLEHRTRRADGTEGWTSSKAIPVFDEHGAIAEWFGMAADITSKKAHEQHIHLLMREVNHRVKNQYAVILSIIRETSKRTTGSRDFERQVQQRIMALSNSHDLLVGSDWKGVSVAELVREQLKPFGNEGRITLSGPNFLLRSNAVQNIGMALHELGTNATKYGALSGKDGAIKVEWRLAANSEHPSDFELVWEEQMVDMTEPAEQRSRGFGTVVLQKVTPISLGGSASLERLPTLLRWTLTAPVHNVIAETTSA